MSATAAPSLGNLGSLASLGSMDPISIGIDLVGDILGLPPELKNIAKIAAGAAMGNPMTIIAGVQGLAQNVRDVATTEWKVPASSAQAAEGYAQARNEEVAPQASPAQEQARATTPRRAQDEDCRAHSKTRVRDPIESPPVTPPPGKDPSTHGASAAQPIKVPQVSEQEAELYRAAQVLADNWDKFDTAILGIRDGIVTLGDLKDIANDPSVPSEIRRAAGYFIDNPDAFAKIHAGFVLGVPGVSRDAVNALARKGEPLATTGAGGPKAPPADGWTPPPPSYRPDGGAAVRDILRDRSLSPMEKLEAIMFAIVDQADAEALSLAQEIEALQDRQAAVGASKDPNGQEQARKLQGDIDRLTQRMQKLIERRSQMMQLISNISHAQHENAMRCIANTK